MQAAGTPGGGAGRCGAGQLAPRRARRRLGPSSHWNAARLCGLATQAVGWGEGRFPVRARAQVGAGARAAAATQAGLRVFICLRGRTVLFGRAGCILTAPRSSGKEGEVQVDADAFFLDRRGEGAGGGEIRPLSGVGAPGFSYCPREGESARVTLLPLCLGWHPPGGRLRSRDCVVRQPR